MKKILLISYYFPPCGGAAVQRWLRLLPLLDTAGYKITVLTTQDGDYPVRDDSLLQKLPSGIEIIRTYTPVFGSLWKRFAGKGKSIPYGSLDNSKSTSVLEKLMYWLRLNVIFPDARVVWNYYAKSKALFLCRTIVFDWIITTGPPQSTHLIGLYLKQQFKTKWIADFRDPWTQIYYLKRNKQNPVIRHINSYMERKVVQTADLNLVISKAISGQLPDGNKCVLYNGYDEQQFEDKLYTRGNQFRIKFIGQLTEGQDINSVLRFISAKTKEHSYNDVAFTFIGTRKFIIPEVHFTISFFDYMPHQQAINEMVDCELLILIINDYIGNQGMLTTKLFEYIASRTPVLCIGPLDGEAASIILETNSGFVSESITERIWDYIDELYVKWQAMDSVRSDHDISQWSVQQQISRLISVLP